MVRIELYKSILRLILKDYSGLMVTSSDYQDINDYIDDDNVEDAAINLKNTPSLPKVFHPWLLSIIEVSANPEAMIATIVSFKKTLLYEKWGSDKKYERCFCYCSPSLFVTDSEYLYHLKNDNAYSQQLWIYLEQLCVKTSDRKELLKGIAQPKRGTFIMAYDKIALGYEINATVPKDQLCSYAYSASLHKKDPVKFNKGLEFDASAVHLSSYNYNKYVVYQQYYDIFDVINDWLHSIDILSAFLRIYQIVEFLIYRQQMSDIIKVSSIKQSFLREIKTLNKKFEQSERGTIVENLPIVFGELTATEHNIAKAEPFIKKYLGQDRHHIHGYLHPGMNVTDRSKALARFVYDMRCCIVHNKEAEFHISYNNYEEYKIVTPLLNEVHKWLAKKVWELMNQPGSVISFEKERYIDLF